MSESGSQQVDDAMDESQSSTSGSPLRRSSRIRNRMNSQSSNDDESSSDSNEEHDDGDEDQENHNHSNHNQNHGADSEQDSDVEFDEKKNEVEEDSDKQNTDNEEDEEEEEEEEELETHPNLATVLPTLLTVNVSNKYNKIEEELYETWLHRIIDTAQSIAEYNGPRAEYAQQTEKLRGAMNKLLALSRDIKIEQLMYSRIAEEIREEKLDELDADRNPIKTEKWDEYLAEYRNALSTEIESGNAKDNEASKIKQFVRDKMPSFHQQFNDAIQVDPIEEYDSDDMQNNHNNHNRHASEQNAGGEEEDDEDDDIVIDKSSNVSMGSIKCPLTMKIFVKPVKSRECGHSFEKENILAYIDEKGRTRELAECPLPGCTNILTKDQLVRDVKTEKLIKKQSKAQPDDDDDEEEAGLDLTVQT